MSGLIWRWPRVRFRPSTTSCLHAGGHRPAGRTPAVEIDHPCSAHLSVRHRQIAPATCFAEVDDLNGPAAVRGCWAELLMEGGRRKQRPGRNPCWGQGCSVDVAGKPGLKSSNDCPKIDSSALLLGRRPPSPFPLWPLQLTTPQASTGAALTQNDRLPMCLELRPMSKS